MIAQALTVTTIGAKSDLEIVFPDNIECEQSTYIVPASQSATITWNANKALAGSFSWATIDHYEVRIKDDTTGEMLLENDAYQSSSLAFTGKYALTAGHNYHMWIGALDSNGALISYSKVTYIDTIKREFYFSPTDDITDDLIARLPANYRPGYAAETMKTALKKIGDEIAIADGQIVVYGGTAAPSNKNVGDIWIDTADNSANRWDGEKWNKISITNAQYLNDVRDQQRTIYYSATKPTTANAHDFWYNTSSGSISRRYISSVNWETPLPTYWTTTGNVCTSHGTGRSNTCITTYTVFYKNGKPYTLAGAQCCAFARLCQMAIYGECEKYGNFPSDDTSKSQIIYNNPNFTMVQGELYYFTDDNGKKCSAHRALLSAPGSNLTEEQKTQYIAQMKSVLSEAGSGAHLRVRGGGHSICLTYVGEDTIKYIEANGSSENCTITQHELSWNDFIFSSYGKGRNGITYYVKYNK